MWRNPYWRNQLGCATNTDKAITIIVQDAVVHLLINSSPKILKEVEIFEFYAQLPPQMMQFMEFEPEHTSRRYGAQLS
jgi:hypothetical protein